MLDPANEFLPPPTSPSISSISSSDLDTESTGSFFHDRSTTLGTLMGVTAFPPITSFISRAPSQRRDAPALTHRKSKKKKAPAPDLLLRRGRRRWWWRLCSDEELKPSKLGEFLEVERRFGDGAVFEVHGVENIDDLGGGTNNNGRLLFADGRVLPPAAAEAGDSCTPVASARCGGLCRLSVSLPGICSGGA